MKKNVFADKYFISLERTSGNHSIIIQNISAILRNHIKHSGCKVFTENVAIKINNQTYPQPDVFVSCENRSSKETYFNDAKLIIEILSDQTMAYDRGTKFTLYKQIPSFSEYVLISQKKKCIWIYRKQDDRWLGTLYHSFRQDVEFQSIELTVNINDIYEDVNF